MQCRRPAANLSWKRGRERHGDLIGVGQALAVAVAVAVAERGPHCAAS
jgi:hypothetical protein